MGFGVWGLGFRFGVSVSALGFQVSGVGFSVSCVGFGVLGFSI